MSEEPDEQLDVAVRNHTELNAKLRAAETEIDYLKSQLLTLSEKLEDAHNEMARMSMLLKHRMQSERPDRRLHAQLELLHRIA